MSPEGELKIQFSKPILPMPFMQNRKLAGSSVDLSSKYDVVLEDAITMEIADQEIGLDKSIAKVELIEAKDTLIEF